MTNQTRHSVSKECQNVRDRWL